MKIATTIDQRNALKGIVLSVRQDDGTWRCFEDGDTLPVVQVTDEQRQAEVLATYDAALMAHYNAVAAQRNYDSYVTVTMRAGYAGPFQAEALAFAQWMDGCNVAGYTLIQEVKAGTKQLPTIEAFIVGLPQMVWPDR